MMKAKNVYAIASDPIYIGTGGYTIGRVDNTIVRDPITRIPKIPGTSVAGTMRFYSALELQFAFTDEYRVEPRRREGKKIHEMINEKKVDWYSYEGNKWALMKCAGQDDRPNESYPNDDFSLMDAEKSGHCGKCIICKTFGYSKKNKSSQQGLVFFSDLNILLFPVYTRAGVKWITSKQLLGLANILLDDFSNDNEVFLLSDKEKKQGTINLGWINLPYKTKNSLPSISKLLQSVDEDNKYNIIENIVLVPDKLISQIINSNLEVRTSVSIDPLTGAAKENALFTSEAIPRGTIFSGDIRIMERPVSNEYPNAEIIETMINEVAKYYEIFGIGGMVTRGFGRIKIILQNQFSK
jgi:CRISPR-associated protein Cmr4